jgi:hypothetical protein
MGWERHAEKEDPCSRRRGAPISKHINVSERTEIWSCVSAGPKNDNAGEGQQHVTTSEKTEGDEGIKWIKVRKNGDAILAGKRRGEGNDDKTDKRWKRNTGERRAVIIPFRI